MITSAETGEVQPPLFVTVKLYEPGSSPGTVNEVPDAVTVMLPGKRVSVQFPCAGSPLMITLPVGRSQVGCVMAPGTGAVGVEGCGLMTTPVDGAETHPSLFLTVKV